MNSAKFCDIRLIHRNLLHFFTLTIKYQKEKARKQSCLKSHQGFPGGAVVENLPANAGGHGFEPWSGKIPHAAEQLGP